MSRKAILYTFAILFLIGSGVAFYGYKEFYRKHEDIADAKSAFQRTAVQLISEFKTDEVASNSKFLGKVLTVSGLVKAIDNSTGLYIISLGDTSDMASVRCSLDSLHSKEAIEVRVGSQIAIKGYCSGFNADELLGSDVILSRCAIDVNTKK
jgi:hypothetical protein